MPKGPMINFKKRNFTTRDNLGINSAGTSFQAELCPTINTVTPRAFYWAFAVWNYYDYWKNCRTGKINKIDFDKKFLKKNDYFFVLSNLIAKKTDQDNLVGKDNCAIDLDKDKFGPYSYNLNYFQSSFGGMQYYMPGCEALGFVTSVDNDGKELQFPKITEKKGLPLAQAFEDIIKNTEYYRNYRLTNNPVPRGVLEELGNTLSLDMNGMEECKRLLRIAFFEPSKTRTFDNKKLILTKKYIEAFAPSNGIMQLDASQIREILFDRFSPGSIEKNNLSDDLQDISTAWETVIGRQYFTLCIELIWKYMIVELKNTPMDLETWITTCLNHAEWSLDINSHVEKYLTADEMKYNEREALLSEGARGSKSVYKNLENSLKVLFSIYKRYNARPDISSDYLSVGNTISLSELINLIDEYKQRSVSELLAFIMTNWIVKRHEMIAFRKMVEGRDGFFFEIIDGRYYFKNYIPYADYAGNRMLQLIHVMKDLDMLV